MSNFVASDATIRKNNTSITGFYEPEETIFQFSALL
ncbi:hypothetical protein SAMN04489724_3934 [Algoriphagus locisalis]|uniref:Uncharacterized protein n=1 Tax=Algoriphagus locisalis TaxID=305507 RepID=A0A1I7DDN6_9BACT|nr:hypothetical protein SAMN04489724_3934 [Algoriphagus locisalis]